VSRQVKHLGKLSELTHLNARFYASVALAVLLIVFGVWALSRATRDSSVDRFSTPAPELEAAPDFALQTLDGETVRLSDYRGQVVLINTWATWCPPCRDEMPDLEAYYRRRQADGFVVLAVNSQESPGTVAAFLEEHNFTFPVLLDPDGVVTKDYRVYGLPTSFFIGRDGVVRGVWSGRLSPKQLKELVDPLL
jgi:cytochrome c biogenesis protein CcmG/thiol:disulfide interchange protein DsbE